ncbi:MAG: TonB family protein [Deltaproteobacteria bacterium]|nr:TonB family protein [Deltaproteobacteria bacterium]
MSTTTRARLTAAFALAIAMVGTAHADDGARRDTPPQPAKAPVMTKAPVLVQAVAPEYPKAALAAGKTADVAVKIHVDADGVVTAVDVVTPVGDGFDEAAQAAAMQYVFDPAEYDGVPGPIVVETTIHFVLDKVVETVPVEPPQPAPDDAPGHVGDARLPVTIRGQIRELSTRRHLGGVIVSIAELGMDVITDDDGNFAFHGVLPGTYKLLVVAERYERVEKPIVLAKDDALDLVVRLRPLNGNPYETVVEGEREVLEVTRRKLTRDQLTSVPGTFGDPIRAIQALPGIARSPFGLGVIIVRGSNPDDTGIFIDGHRVPGIFHFLGGPSIINPEFLDSIELYPGGFPARFGRQHGGVVAIETRASKSDGVHGSLAIDILNAAGYVRAPITKRVSVAVAGRRSYLDGVLALLLPKPKAGAQRVVVPVYYDGQARVDVDLGKEGKLSVLGLISSDALKVVNSNPDEQASLKLNAAIDFFRVIGKYTRPLAGDLTLTLSPAFGRDSVAFSGSQAQAAGPYSQLAVTQNTLSYRMRVAGRLGKHTYLDSGIDYESRVTNYDVLAAIGDDFRNSFGADLPTEQLNRGVSQTALGLHGDVAIDLGKLRLVPGLRVDGYVLSGQTRASIDPRLVAKLALSSMWTGKAYAGVFHQPPQPEAFDQRFGNPAIGIERGLHGGIGAEWQPDRMWHMDVEAYVVRRQNLVAFTNDVVVNEDGTATPVNFRNSGDGWTYGFEGMIRRELSERAYGWLTYTFSRSKRRLNNEMGYALNAFDQTHIINAVASYKLGRGWELGARFRLATGLPETQPSGATFDADSGGYLGVDPGFRTARAPYFTQTDVRAEKSWLFDTWSMGVYLDIQNVFARDNVEAIEYDYRFRKSAPVTSVPFLPTLGIRGQW